MFSFTPLFLAASLLGADADDTPRQPPMPTPLWCPAIACLHDGNLYAMRPPVPGDAERVWLHRRPFPEMADRNLWGASLDVMASDYGGFDFISAKTTVRWHVGAGELLLSDRPASSGWFRALDLKRLDDVFGKKDNLAKSRLANELYNNKPWGGVSKIHRWFAVRIEPELENIPAGQPTPDPRTVADARMHYDMLPTGKDAVRRFIATDDEMTVSDGTGKWEKQNADKEWVVEWKEVEKFKVPVAGPFQVFPKGDDYFFVAASGMVFAAPKPAKGPREATQVKTPGNRIVEFVFADQERDRVYVSGRDPKDEGKWWRLELGGANDKPRRFERKKPEPTGRLEVLRMAEEFAAGLADDGLLK